MLSRRIALGAALGALAISLQCNVARAQYYGAGCSGCGTSMAAPITAASCCTPIPPVQTTCYQTVPVTTYAQVKQTVEVPRYETAMEEREVTVYRPVTSSREVEVPTVSYQNVVENRTVNRDMGRWVTNYHPVAKCAPGRVDARPGVLGWMSRTGYSMRTAFVPNYTTSRQYVPSMMTCNVPSVRQVAVQGTRRVTVQETKMVAERKMEKISVQKLVMRKEEVTVLRPQTAYRTVPIGSSMAYGGYYGSPQMAFGYPIIDGTTQTAQRPTPDAIGGGAARSATKDNFEADKPYDRSDSPAPANGASYEAPDRENEPTVFPPSARRAANKAVVPTAHHRSSSITAAAETAGSQPSRWHATRKSSERSVSQSDLTKPSISMADSVRER